VWITNPFTAPFIYGSTYFVGAKLLGLKAALALPEELTWSLVEEMLRNAPVILGALTVGGALVGLPLAVLGYYLAYMAVNKYQQRVKEQVAIQKARMLNTKEKVKQKIHQRRMKK
jgi:uncharacterized protein (DUF2062 family)